MFLKPKQNAQFDDEHVGFVPKQSEILYLGNRSKECAYYLTGLNQCRFKMAKLAGNPESSNHQSGFLPCKRLVDAHYRCMTLDKYGYSIEEAPQPAKESSDKFFNCFFQELKPLTECRSDFDQVVREIYRLPSSKINVNY